jgi:hypothetical protein
MRVTSAISRRMIDLCTAVPQPQPRPGSVHKEHPFNAGTDVAYLKGLSREMDLAFEDMHGQF